MKTPIALDIETSGLYPDQHGILAIGAVDLAFYNFKFYMETRLKSGQLISEKALSINGFSKDYCFDSRKPYPEVAWEVFKIMLSKKVDLEDVIFVGQNFPSFDLQFIKALDTPFGFGHRHVDMHSLLIGKTGESIKSKRWAKRFDVKPEPHPHNALEGAKYVKRVWESLNIKHYIGEG